MVIAERLHGVTMESRVLRLADRWPSTATSAANLRTFYKLPEDVRGLRILDVCAGESDLTAVLTGEGAEAYALDILYDQPTYLHERVARNYVVHYVDEDLTPESEWYKEIAAELDSFEEIKRFRDSFQRERFRYRQGSAHALPFPTGFFHFVLSYNGVLGVTQEDPLVLRASVAELVRVVMPGGQIQLGPMIAGDSQTESGRINQENQIKLLKRRKDLSVVFEAVEFKRLKAQRLTIAKK